MPPPSCGNSRSSTLQEEWSSKPHRYDNNNNNKFFIIYEKKKISDPSSPPLPSLTETDVGQQLQAQEKEVGDGTNLVIALAGSLMAETEQLLRTGLHPNDVISGYAIGQREALRIAEGTVLVHA